MPSTFTDDGRDRQRKALERYEAQKEAWANMQRKLAEKVNRSDPNDTLPGSIHGYRQKVEETTMLEASAPSEFRSGQHAWEMNLRASSVGPNSGGGVRYVQLGAPYPYPLYVPVRDGVKTDPDSNSMMKIIPDTATNRTAPLASGYTASQFLAQRKEEFKRHMQRNFSHFLPDQGPLVVLGGPPPTTNERIEGEALKGSNLDPITYHQPVAVEDELGGTNSEMPSTMDNPLALPDSTPLQRRHSNASSVAASSSQAAISHPGVAAPPSGPSLVIGSANLLARVQPGEVAQLPLTVNNTGSTAVFYNWSVREQDAVPGLTANRTDNNFILSDVPSGVLLPEDEKIFVFSLRPKKAGSYSQTLELLTVPAGKERILVHLQVFAVSDDPNVALTSTLENAMTNKSLRNELRTQLTAISFEARNNSLTAADYRHATAQLKSAQSSGATARTAEVAAEKARWLSLNDFSATVPPLVVPPVAPPVGRVAARGASPVPNPESRLDDIGYDKNAIAATRVAVPYHPAVYQRLSELHFNVQTFLAASEMVGATPAPSKTTHPSPPTGVTDTTNAAASSANVVVMGTPRRPSISPRQGSLSPRRFSRLTPRNGASVASGEAVVETPADVVDRYIFSEEGRLASFQKAFLKASDALINKAQHPVGDSDCPPSVVHHPDPAVQWDGSIRQLLEDISGIRDAPLRNRMFDAASLLVRLCVECGDAPEMQLKDMITHVCRTDCFKDAATDSAFFAAHTAVDMAKGRGYPRAQGEEPAGKGGKAAVKKSGAGKRPASADKTASGIDITPEVEELRRKEFAEAASSRILGAAKDAAAARAKAAMGLIIGACDTNVFIAEAARLGTIARLTAIHVADVDTNVDPVKKKR